MIDWVSKNYKILGILTTIALALLGWGYNIITSISELRVNQTNVKDQISDLNKRVIFLERLKMASSPDIKGKVDTTSLAQNSLSLSKEQFNDTLNIIRNENPQEAMKSLEKKSYFSKEQLPEIFTIAPQNLDATVK